jgi:hypothetical protein
MEGCRRAPPLIEGTFLNGRNMPEKRITFRGNAPGRKVSSVVERHYPHKVVFLLSPANSSGVRAKMLFRSDAQFDLALRLRRSGAPLGEIYTFISGLYFRGKLAYANQFRHSSPEFHGVHIITPAAGLLPPQVVVTLEELSRISSTSVDAENPDYRGPLDRDALRLRSLLEPDTHVVLLGSIATSKYVAPLLEVFGERLLFPKTFEGRGDMSRGGLLLRCCLLGTPLEYAPVTGAPRRGRRPPKLNLG